MNKLFDLRYKIYDLRIRSRVIKVFLRRFLDNPKIQQFNNRLANIYSKIGRKWHAFTKRFEKYQKLFRKILVVTSLVYVLGLTFIIIHLFQLDTGFPQGREALQDVVNVDFVAKNFLPRSGISLRETAWNPYWENGQPFFAGAYWGVLGVLGRLGLPATPVPLSVAWRAGAADLVRISSVVNILLIITTFFGIAYFLSKRLLLALAIPLFLLASPIFWAYVIDYGEHGRLFSFTLFILYIYVLLLYFRIDKHSTSKKIFNFQFSIFNQILKIKFLNIKTFISNFKFQISNLYYITIVFLLILLFLSDFWLGVLSVVILGGLGLFGGLGESGKKRERLRFFVKTVGIALGLSAFYLVPQIHLGGDLAWHLGSYPSPSPAGGEGGMVEILFKQAYPGPHVLVLSLAGLLLLAVLIVRDRSKNSAGRSNHMSSWSGNDHDRISEAEGDSIASLQNDKYLRNILYLFAGLTILFVLFALGKIPFATPPTESINLIYLITFFAVITIAIGCSYLGKEAVSSRILLVAVAALTAISLQNTKTLAGHRFVYPSSLSAPVDASTFDTSKQYRVYYPPGRESEMAILYKKYDLLFTAHTSSWSEAIGSPKDEILSPRRAGLQNDNVIFFFDWFGVREVYLYKDGGVENPAFDTEDFEKRGEHAIYKKATPIVYGTNSQPVLFYAKDGGAYQEQVHDLASKGLSLERVIPIRTKRWTEKSSIPIVSSVEELDNVILERLKASIGSRGDSIGRSPKATSLQNDKYSSQQEMAYKSPTQWEIKLDKQYRGIVFKQTYDKNWQAVINLDCHLERSERSSASASLDFSGASGDLEMTRLGNRNNNSCVKKLSIFQAGPNMMYVFLPRYEGSVKVRFVYGQSLGEKLGVLITIGIILFVVLMRIPKMRAKMKSFNFKFSIRNLKSNLNV